MKAKLMTAITAIILLGPLLAGFGLVRQGVWEGKRISIALGDSPAVVDLWQEVALSADERQATLVQHSGDLLLEGLGEPLGFGPWPGHDRHLVAIDYDQEQVGIFHIDPDSTRVTNLGNILIRGARPRLEIYSWPYLLLSADNGQGSFNWLLVSLASGTLEIIWQYNAWVPLGLRQQPVWHHDGRWFLGPVGGPSITEIHPGSQVTALHRAPLNPLVRVWPLWTGHLSGSSFFVYPTVHGDNIALDIATGSHRLLNSGSDLAWCTSRRHLAWLAEGALWVDDESIFAGGAQLAGSPRWSEASDILYFIVGDEDYFGRVWQQLWAWEPGGEAYPLQDLPGSWERWQLVAAGDDSVVALTGKNREILVYFDLSDEKIYTFRDVGAEWLWRGGTLLVREQDRILRATPGFGSRVLHSGEGDLQLLGLVNLFVIYSDQGRVYIRQLAERG